MMRRRRFLKLPLAGMALLAAPGTLDAALGQDKAEAVAKAESYLNGIRTLQARFVQISSNGAYAEGDVFVRRPGRLRFEYDPPHPVLLIADGVNLLYYDKELKQSTFIPLWETPLWFLVRERVDLSSGVRATEVAQANGVTRITLEQAGGAEAGRVTLVFDDQPFALRKWEVTDAQGITTQVALMNPRYGIEVADDVFDYGDLDLYGFKGRRDR